MSKSFLLSSLPTVTPCTILWILPAPPHPISFLLQTQIPNPLSLALSFSSPSCLPQKSFSLYGHIAFSFTGPHGCRRTMKHPPGPPWAMLSWAVLPWGSQIHHLQAACCWLGTSCLVKIRRLLLSILSHTPTLATSNRVGREESVTAHSWGCLEELCCGHTWPTGSGVSWAHYAISELLKPMHKHSSEELKHPLESWQAEACSVNGRPKNTSPGIQIACHNHWDFWFPIKS